MGFVQAIADIGGLDRQAGLESYLKYPLEKGGKSFVSTLTLKTLMGLFED